MVFTYLIKSKNKIMKNQLQEFILKWYPIIIAFICLLYSVTLGLTGHTEEAQYTAHLAGTILLFAIAIRQRNRS